MTQLLKLQPPFQALDRFLATIPARIPQAEEISSLQAYGRVLAEDIFAPHPMPEFPRSTMDGYVMAAASTQGAGESSPISLKLIGEVPMGEVPAFTIRAAQCALIHTGGMIPEGADAVVPLEQSQSVGPEEVKITQTVAPYENVILAGEDIHTGDRVISAGKVLRIPEIGGLMSIGHLFVKAARKPLVGILSSGDEVIPADSSPRPGQVRDINSTTLCLFVREEGGEPRLYGIAPDDPEKLRNLAQQALAECEMVLVTAGSSASSRDMTASIIQELGQPGILAHGVSVRPGKPTILAVCDGKPVIGLPGNPVSALVIASIFVAPVIHRMLGQGERGFHPSIPARMTASFPSLAGREDWIPVSLRQEGEEWLADPIYFKSNLIFNLVRADALVHIPADLTGLQAGEVVATELL